MIKESITKEFLQEYFHADFKGIDSLLTEILVPIFGDAKLGYTEFTASDTLRDKAKAVNIQSIKHAASLDADGYEIKVFDVTLYDNCHIHIARKGIQTLIRSFIGHFEGALIVFHYSNPEKRSWRLSYLEKRSNNTDSTSAKRYTYLCGRDYACRTIAERFALLANQEKNAVNIDKAFSVEALSDEFFSEYKEQYQSFCDFIVAHRTDTSLFGEEFASCEDKFIRDYVKKLMGRLTFLHFLQKRGWLGQPRGIEGWGDGNLNFLHELFDKASNEQKDNFLDEVLEPLFFECLNEKREGDFFDTQVPGIRIVKIPYLNGGLFEKDAIDEPCSKFPREMFQRLFDFYSRYNFTIDESDPLDTEVGVDPEMLGKIFENLLEDNKDKGAFYTPKEIVRYMCQEALIAYLVSEAKKKAELVDRNAIRRQENFEDAIRRFVADPTMSVHNMRQYPHKLEDLQEALTAVKICDPAIGSGAFPMGLLNLLVDCRTAINEALGIGVPRAVLKQDIILHNIYGVDIEKGAIDIARLRFWLSIVVDEDEPHPLPNFDYKFMQGNSLLEQFEGLDLSNMFSNVTEQEGKGKGNTLIIFDEEATQRALLREKLNRYFSLNADEDKHVLRQQVNEAVVALIKEKTPGRNDMHTQLDAINVSANEHFFLWHTWFADVFEQGGFDIVIGNPPYLFLSGKGSPVKKLLKEGKIAEATALQKVLEIYKRTYPEASSGCCDFYKWFFALAVKLCKCNGVISYITPDTYFNMPKYRDIRQLLLHNTVHKLIDLGFHVFDAPIVSSSIVVLQVDKKTASSTSFVDLKNILTKENRCDLNSYIEDGIESILIHDFEISAYKHPIAENIYMDIEDIFFTINHFLNFTEGEHNIQIDREEIINCSKEGYVPVLIDKDISKFSYVERGYIPSQVEISPIHQGERCILRKTGDTIVVAIPRTFEAALAHQNVYVVKTESRNKSIKFWFGILNSKMLTFLYQNGLYGQKGRTMAQFRKYALDILPVPKNILSQEKTIINIVDQILAAKKTDSQTDTSALESQIDELVYDLYGLTEEEKEIVRNS